MKNTLSWILQALAAIIMLQTLFFKFTAAPESVELFTKLGMEPLGRIGTGIAELIASILLFTPKRIWFGALMGIGLMAGAIFSHLTVIGIAAPKPNGADDGGLLFIMALITLISCVIVLWIRKEQFLGLLKK